MLRELSRNGFELKQVGGASPPTPLLSSPLPPLSPSVPRKQSTTTLPLSSLPHVPCLAYSPSSLTFPNFFYVPFLLGLVLFILLEMRQVANDVVDSNSTLPRVGRAWRESPGPWDQLPSFPSARVYEHTRQRMASNKRAVRRRASRDPSMVLHAAMPMAYTRDVTTQSTNLIGRLRSLGG